MFSTTRPESGKTLKTCQPVIDFANSVVVTCAHIVKVQSQKKGVSPAVVRQHQLLNNVSCVDQLSSVNLEKNIQTVASDLPVEARLHQFWKAWEALGAGLKVLRMLKEGYT